MDSLWSPIDCDVSKDSFQSPFDEIGPPLLARRAAEILQAELSDGRLTSADAAAPIFATLEGKMFGVLVVADSNGCIGFLRAFSGTIAGRFDLPGFVPPMFDRSARATIETEGEATVKRLTAHARAFASTPQFLRGQRALAELATRHREQRAALRTRHDANRTQRRNSRAAMRASTPDAASPEQALHELAQQSRADKAERRRLEEAQEAERLETGGEHLQACLRLAAHERLHAMLSSSLMRKIHETYRVTNARRESCSLRSLYAPAEPTAGAGDCAAPKLLSYAYAGGLRPLALAEFWWGPAPASGGRVSGNFYPACRDKCGPLLPFMLEGLAVTAPRVFVPPDASAFELRVLFADEWIVVVEKPCGLLSVPARDRTLRGSPGDSVLTRLRARYGDDCTVAHRLDLDTSGVLVAVRSPAAYKIVQRQFMRRTVEKRYVALVDGVVKESSGRIDLPIRLDLSDRPRQIHDPDLGRHAVTDWRVLAREPGRTRIALTPLTGRTHQLRVHASHPLGLGAPIVGDRLYGRSCSGERLMLHAESIALTHPATGERIAFQSSTPF